MKVISIGKKCGGKQLIDGLFWEYNPATGNRRFVGVAGKKGGVVYKHKK